MKTTTSQIEQVLITEAPGLDPIRVIMEQFDAGTGGFGGHLTVMVFCRAWATCWGNMGCPLREFVAGANTSYIVGRLVGSAEPTNKKKRSRDEVYLTRIVDAIKLALSQEGGAA